MSTAGAIAKCRSLPSATESYPFGPGALVFKVGGKVFAIVADDAISLKCEPGLAEALREEYPDAVKPGYHLNKRHWNTVALNGTVPADILAEWIEDSYALAAASLTRAQARLTFQTPSGP